MKRMILCILCICLLLPILGCTETDIDFKEPGKFYYCNSEIQYGKEDGLISYELQETSHIQNDLNMLLDQFLRGPTTDSLLNIFPSDITFISADKYSGMIIINMNAPQSEFSGINRTIAFACLSMTLFDYTDANYIQIRIVDEHSDLVESMIFTENDMHLYDHFISPTEAQ